MEKSAAMATETAAVSELTDLPLPYRQIVFNAGRPGKFSLLLFLHGAGERGNDNERTKVHAVGKISEYIRSRGLKVVMLIPQCPAELRWVERPWGASSLRMPPEPSRPMKAATALLDAKAAEFSVDPAQIRVCGISMGGYGTWDLLCRRPEFFAAAFAVCGGGDETQAPKLKDINVTVFHGADDRIVPAERSRSMVAALRKAGGEKVLYVELPGVGHCSWEIAFGDVPAMDKFFAALLK
jgi:predicted peptidase